MSTEVKLYSDTPVTWLDRDTGREIAKGKLKAGTRIRVEGSRVYTVDGGYLFRFEYDA